MPMQMLDCRWERPADYITTSVKFIKILFSNARPRCREFRVPFNINVYCRVILLLEHIRFLDAIASLDLGYESQSVSQ